MKNIFTRIRQYLSSPLLAIIITILGIFVSIFYPLINKPHSSLLLQRLGSLTISKNDAELKPVSIYYGDKQINSITISNFLLLNNGDNPISIGDVFKHITISYDYSTKILDAGFDKSYPKNIDCNFKIDSTERVLVVSFNLLNSDDAIFFHTVTSGTNTFNLVSRIRGIKDILIKERQFNSGESHGDPLNSLSFMIVFLIIEIKAVFGGIRIRKGFLRFEKLYLKGDGTLPRYNKIKDYNRFVKTDMNCFSPKKTRDVYYYLDSQKPGDNDLHIKIVNFITKAFYVDRRSNLIYMVFELVTIIFICTSLLIKMFIS